MPLTGPTATRLPLRVLVDNPLDTSRAPAREAAKRELSRPMYHENDPNLLQRTVDRVWDWVGDLLGSVSGAAPGGAAGLAVICLIVAAIVVALWWRLGAPRSHLTPTGSLFDDRPHTAAEHRAAAETHAAEERWNAALQERMRAIVRALEERALLESRLGRTADEAAIEAGHALPRHTERLRSAARAFDEVMYGGRDADERAYLRLRELDVELERTKPRLNTPAPETVV